MIKLIASDLDGTLVPQETSVIDPEIFTYIRKLNEKGIRFVAASGRQYASILKVFEPVRNEIMFIADNGGYVIEHDEILLRCTFAKDIYSNIVRFITDTFNAKMMISSAEGDFTNSSDPVFLSFISDNFGLELTPVKDPAELDINVSKVAVYGDHEMKKVLQKEGAERFGNDANVMISSEHWMDFIPKEADKGTALSRIQNMLGISLEETMCFGDQNNDIGLLRRGEESYAVADAAPSVKAAAKHIMTEGPFENGVLHVLKEVFGL